MITRDAINKLKHDIAKTPETRNKVEMLLTKRTESESNHWSRKNIASYNNS